MSRLGQMSSRHQDHRDRCRVAGRLRQGEVKCESTRRSQLESTADDNSEGRCGDSQNGTLDRVRKILICERQCSRGQIEDIETLCSRLNSVGTSKHVAIAQSTVRRTVSSRVVRPLWIRIPQPHG